MRLCTLPTSNKMASLIACECLASPCSLQAPPADHSMLARAPTAAAAAAGAAPALFDQLDKALKGGDGKELVAKTKVRPGCASSAECLPAALPAVCVCFRPPPPHTPGPRIPENHTQGLVVFLIDGQHWTLDLREGAGTVTQGPPIDKPDLTLTISDDNFAKMVMGKLSPQQVRGQDCTVLNWRTGSLLKPSAAVQRPSRASRTVVAVPARTRRWLRAAALSATRRHSCCAS